MKDVDPNINDQTPARSAARSRPRVKRLLIIEKFLSTQAFIAAFATLGALNFLAFDIHANLLVYVAGEGINRNDIINYAPEVWLSLLAFVFGTLVIVITIAAESTPKLIDFFVSDYRSRFYIWVITFSILQNVVLQLIQVRQVLFFDNLIFLNNYILLPS